MDKQKGPPIYMCMAVKWDFEVVAKSMEGDKILSEWLHRSENKKRRIIIRERRWGFFYDPEIAKQSVREDWGFNFDEAGHYNGAIIERINEGYCDYEHPPQRWFFRHRPDFKAGDTELCEEFPEPLYYKQVCGLTIG